jgi:hypothetical protein
MLALLATAAHADAPLPAAEDWRRTDAGGVVVEGILDPHRITITPPQGGAAWSLPFWLRELAVHPAADGESVLISNTGGNLLSWSGDPEETVLWIYRAPGQEVARVPLRAIMRPGRMRRTASHYVWITGYAWADGGWIFATPDGRSWHLTPDAQLTRR